MLAIAENNEDCFVASLRAMTRLRFHYGGQAESLSQAYGSVCMPSDCKQAASYAEIIRVMGQNLNGVALFEGDSSYGVPWVNIFEPVFEARKAKYLNDANVPFVKDVNWPISSTTGGGWFLTPGFDPQNTNDLSWSTTTATIHWTTPVDANSEVVYTKVSNGVWWDYVDSSGEHGPDGKSSSSIMTTDHCRTLTGLVANKTYKFKIRSTNDTNNPPNVSTQIIWGYVGSFTTSP